MAIPCANCPGRVMPTTDPYGSHVSAAGRFTHVGRGDEPDHWCETPTPRTSTIPTASRLSLAEELEQLPPADSIVGEVTLSRAYDRACDIAAEALAECQRYESVLNAIIEARDRLLNVHVPECKRQADSVRVLEWFETSTSQALDLLPNDDPIEVP